MLGRRGLMDYYESSGSSTTTFRRSKIETHLEVVQNGDKVRKIKSENIADGRRCAPSVS